jgi:hypothetical protein
MLLHWQSNKALVLMIVSVQVVGGIKPLNLGSLVYSSTSYATALASSQGTFPTTLNSELLVDGFKHLNLE